MTAQVAGETPAASLLWPSAIRERCGNILAAADAAKSRHFRVDRSRLDAAAMRVEAVTRRRYPTLAIPYHSRWRHFEAGGVDRIDELDRALEGRDAAACARARIDLAVVSVLLDAGAGAAWRFVERETGQRHTRSEGLGVASFRAFMAGAFSARRDDRLRVDAEALERIDAATLARLFQVDGGNPLVGLDGRAALLRRLAVALRMPADDGTALERPGALLDIVPRGAAGPVRAPDLLYALLERLGSIWPASARLDGVMLGDAWRHRYAGGEGTSAGWVPFHKLSQWLAYSLFEPFEWAGVKVTGRDDLTALSEYRNGGLLLDTGVLRLVDDVSSRGPQEVGSELVVEWRALTVAMIDELAPLVRRRLGVADLPLACILEGGTWAAGRELAQDLRGGDPPLSIESDGTVF